MKKASGSTAHPSTWFARLARCWTLLVTGFFVATGCAAPPKVTWLAPVGPNSNRSSGPASGYLVVYTSTEPSLNTGRVMYYPHTSYLIYDARGKLVRSIPNHISNYDEIPSKVALPPGNYVVHAESESAGAVAVPVSVRALRTTVVNLEKRRTDSLAAS